MVKRANKPNVTDDIDDTFNNSPEPVSPQADPNEPVAQAASQSKREATPQVTHDQVRQQDNQTVSDSSRSSNNAITNAVTNKRTKKDTGTSALLTALDSADESTHHPQLERATKTVRLPVWVIKTLSRKSSLTRRSQADLLADLMRDVLADDDVAAHYYAEAATRLGVPNDWNG